MCSPERESMVGLRPMRCHTSSMTSSRMVQSFRVVIGVDGLCARLGTPGTYFAPTECPAFPIGPVPALLVRFVLPFLNLCLGLIWSL